MRVFWEAGLPRDIAAGAGRLPVVKICSEAAMPRLSLKHTTIPILAAAAFALAATASPARAQGEYTCPPGYYYDPAYGCRSDYYYGSPYWYSPGLGFYFGGRGWGGHRDWRGGAPHGGFGGGFRGVHPGGGWGGGHPGGGGHGGWGGGGHGGGHHRPINP
jgi:hypothetical protein